MWNAQHRWAGSADVELSPAGRESAIALAHRLAPCGFAALASSPLRRATETAGILASRLGLSAPAVVPELRERAAGEWTGRTSVEAEAGFPGQLDRWRAGRRVDPPGAEDWDEFVARSMAGVRLAADLCGEGPVLAVTHQGVLRGLEHALGLDPAPAANLDALWLS